MMPPASETDLTACFMQDITGLLDFFSEKDSAGKQSLQQMISADSAAFSRASIQVLAGQASASASTARSTEASACLRYLTHLLRKQDLLIGALIDPRESRLEDALAATRAIPQFGSPIDDDLQRVLGAVLQRSATASNIVRVLRILDLMEASSAPNRISLFQTELMSYSDSAVRAKAALLIARASKNAVLVGRMLLDDDVQVQANAVEALWTFDPEEARPLLLTASRSRHNRVAGNAAVGLYRIGDLSGLRLMFDRARHENPETRATAIWAMGETGDPRFLPFLTARFPESAGPERVAVLQALARIRRREKNLGEAGAIDVRIWSASTTPAPGDQASDKSTRHLALTLRSPEPRDLSAIRPTHFALWESGTLIQDYEVSVQPNPALLISGFAVPRFQSDADAYRLAIIEGMERCLKFKRPEDPWRVDRYLLEKRSGPHSAPLEKAALPYEESLLGSYAKSQQRGFLTAPEVLQKIIVTSGARERAATDVFSAFDRLTDAMVKFFGKRLLFLFLHPSCNERLDRNLAQMTALAANERIAIHGIAPMDMGDCEGFRSLCLTAEGGTFHSATPAELPHLVESLYLQSLNRFDVTYTMSGASTLAEGSLLVTSDVGCGRASFSFGVA